MAITSKPKPKIAASAVAQNDAAEAFIRGAPDAPDAAPSKAAVRREVKRLISLKITPTLLDRVDQLAAELGQSRAAVINLAIHRAVEHGLEFDGLGKV